MLIPALGLPGWVQRLVALFLILGFPLVLIFAWAYELTPDGLKKQHEVDRVPSNSHETGRKLNHLIGALAALAIAVVVVDRLLPEEPRQASTGEGGAALKQPGPSVAASPSSAVAINSIAVLPFVNMSSDPEQEYFSDGLAEELLNLLAKLPELRVIGRTSSFQFKGRNEGSAGDRREAQRGSYPGRKCAQIRTKGPNYGAARSRCGWISSVVGDLDRTLEDIFGVQDDIAAQVVKALEVTLLGGDSPLPARAPDVEAYNLFLQGRYLAQRQSAEDSKRAIPYLQRSLDRDPSYAPAWVELADVNMTQADYGWIPSAEAYSRAREAVHQALVLDPNLASAHCSGLN